MPHHIEKLEGRIICGENGEKQLMNPTSWVITDKINEIIDFLNTLPAHKGEHEGK